MSALYNTAIRWATEAVRADREGDLSNAITLYMLACEYLIGAVKHDRIPQRSKAIKRRIASYLDRAEALKVLVCGSDPVGAKTHKYQPTHNRAVVDRRAKGTVGPREFAPVSAEDAVGWRDVGGLAGVKDVLDEALIFPQKHPELFKGKRQPWKGILMFGPPGTGKTLAVKAAAKESGLPVAFISAADIMSKWQGESERHLKELFAKARKTKPCIIFVDEIDSIGRVRSEGEQESLRRLKTELLRQLDGVGTDNAGVTFIAATNTPWELDPALRRRFDQMVYLPLPNATTREQVLRIHLEGDDSEVKPSEYKAAAQSAKGYSAADLQIIAREALMLPIRRALTHKYFKQVTIKPPGEVWARKMWMPCSRWEFGSSRKNMLDLDPDSVYIPKVSGADLHEALEGVSKSVSEAEVKRYEAFRDKFRARDGATGSGVSAGMRPATSTSVASGAGAGVGAGAGAAVSAASRMPDAPTGGILSSIASAFSSLFSSTEDPPGAPERRLVPG